MKSFILRTAISCFFIGLLFYLVREDFPKVVLALKNIHKPLLLASVLLCLSTVFIMARRLQIIFAVENVRVGLMRAADLTFIGYFFNNFLPTSVGGDIVKALCASRVTGEPVKAVSSVLMDRIFGLFTFILMPSISFIFIMKEISNPKVPLVIYSFLLFSLFCFFLLFNQDVARRFRFMKHFLAYLRLLDKAKKVYDRLHNFKNHKRVITQAMLLSFVGQSISITVIYLLARALGRDTNILYFFLLVPIVHLMSMIPSLNGLGVREWAYLTFLTPYVGRDCAFALGILWLGVLFLLSLIGGIIYLVKHEYHVRLGGKQSPETLL